MIRGYFAGRPRQRRPFITGVLQLPAIANRELAIEFLVDKGADRTLLAPLDVSRLGLDLSALAEGPASTGVGGRMTTRTAYGMLILEDQNVPLTIAILSPAPGLPTLTIPSLLGRDILSRYALFIDQRTERVLLLTPDETEALNLPLMR